MILERLKKMIWGIVIIIAGIGLDQITKLLARKFLAPKKSITIIKDFFNLTYVENKGGAWGTFSGKLWLFIIVTVIALGVMFYLLKDFDLKNNKLYSIGLTLVISGAIGNFIDRVINGYVIDFVYFELINFPVFNVADIYITVSGFFLIILFLFYYNDDDFDTVFSIKRKDKNTIG